MARRVAVVITTISDGTFLARFVEALSQHPDRDNFVVLIVGDLNTPTECAQTVASIRNSTGTDIRFLDMSSQSKLLCQFPELIEHIPYRSTARRNVGFLWTLENDFEVLLSMDDDNVPNARLFQSHGQTGRRVHMPIAEHAESWFNCMILLESVDARGFPAHLYPRGFPYKRRFRDASRIGTASRVGRVGVTAGLWLGDPDVDAASRLTLSPQSRSVMPRGAALAVGARCPVSSQNTSIVRDAIPAYFFPAPSALVGGGSVTRFGDILSGLFLQMCAESVGDIVTFGPPAATHLRNQHDLIVDLCNEIGGLLMVDYLCEWFERPLSKHVDYGSAYLELVTRLDDMAGRSADNAPAGAAEYIRELQRGMAAWHRACRTLS